MSLNIEIQDFPKEEYSLSIGEILGSPGFYRASHWGKPYNALYYVNRHGELILFNEDDLILVNGSFLHYKFKKLDNIQVILSSKNGT